MKKIIPMMLLMAAIAAPATAQQIDVGVWAVSTTLQGDNRIDDVQDIEIVLDENIGVGAAADIRWSDLISTELAIYALDADGVLDLGFIDEQVDLGSFDFTPVTLTLRAHFGSGALDFYVGAGAAHVLFDDLSSEDLIDLGTGTISVDDTTTWLGNVGLTWLIGEEFGIGVDAKWIDLEADTVSGTGEELTLELDPLMISAGIFLRL